MLTNDVPGLQDASPDEAAAYKRTSAILVLGKSNEEVADYYSNWAREGTYEKMLCPSHYNGPSLVAQIVERYFGDRKDDAYIVDVGAGTGFVGEELKKRGYTKIDALDGCLDMLSIASSKNIYSRIINDIISSHRTSIKNDTYDVLVLSAAMAEGHIPTVGLAEMIRIVKPGGCVCIIMREEFLTDVSDYADRLEPFMHQLAEQGAWTREERTVVPNYWCPSTAATAFDKPGVVFVYRVNQSGAPTVTSNKFTK